MKQHKKFRCIRCSRIWIPRVNFNTDCSKGMFNSWNNFPERAVRQAQCIQQRFLLENGTTGNLDRWTQSAHHQLNLICANLFHWWMWRLGVGVKILLLAYSFCAIHFLYTHCSSSKLKLIILTDFLKKNMLICSGWCRGYWWASCKITVLWFVKVLSKKPMAIKNINSFKMDDRIKCCIKNFNFDTSQKDPATW